MPVLSAVCTQSTADEAWCHEKNPRMHKSSKKHLHLKYGQVDSKSSALAKINKHFLLKTAQRQWLSRFRHVNKLLVFHVDFPAALNYKEYYVFSILPAGRAARGQLVLQCLAHMELHFFAAMTAEAQLSLHKRNIAKAAPEA